MRNGRQVLVAFLALQSLSAPRPGWSQSADPRPWRVLALAGDARHLPAFRRADSAFAAVFSAAGQPLEYTVDYVDMNPLVDQRSAAAVRQNYGSAPPDLIVARGPEIMEHLVSRSEPLFPGVPVLFLGVASQQVRSGERFPPGMTGVLLELNFRATVQAALGLQPDARHIVVVAGSSWVDQDMLDRALGDLARLGESRELIPLTGMSLQAITDSVGRLPRSAVILYIHVFEDATGRLFIPAEVARTLAQAASAPVYGVHRTYLGSGIVGGKLASWASQGMEAGEMALRILQGDRGAALPAPRRIGAVLEFDEGALRRWDLDPGKLPPGSVLHSRRPAILSTVLFWVGVAVILVQAGLIVRLLLSRRRERQSALQHSALQEELTQVTRSTSMSELSTTLAHELSQPLAAIRTNADAARRFLEAPEPDLDEVRIILSDITESDVRASEVIQQMRALLLTRRAAARVVDINTVADAAVTLCRRDARFQSVRITTHLHPDVAPIAGDRVQLRQVFLNLLINAVEAISSRGLGSDDTITVITLPNENGVEIRIRDTGPGLPPQVSERLFQPFTSSKPHGLGVGLSICRAIVSAHGGTIAGVNDPKGGAVFKLQLPTVNPTQ